MKILVLGNSSVFNRKVLPAFKKFKNLEIELASKRIIKNDLVYSKNYKSYTNALKKTKAKLVYISLVNSKHYFWAKKCLEYKKHVIIDKPFTLNFKETSYLILLAKKYNLFISEVIVFHYHKQFKQILKKINFKKNVEINTFFHIPKLEQRNFRKSQQLGGGCFQDMSSYAAYMIKIFFKKKKFIFKKINHNYFLRNSNSFSFIAKTSKTILKSSFSFNKPYKNYMIIKSDNNKYKINYIFSPPIDRNLIVSNFDNKSKKNITISFQTQNTFYTYFKKIFNIIEKKKFSFFYKELNLTSEIKNDII